jgi:hypothetical protein
MKIVYVGGNLAEGSPPFSTENAYIDALRGLGHEVLPIKQGMAPGISWPDPDLVIYTRTHNDTALTPEFTATWRRLEDAGARTASVHLDVFRGIPEREGWVARGDPLFTTQHVFTADGGSDAFWVQHGVNHHWLPPAADLRHVGPFPTPELDLDGKIVFVGSEGYHACYPFRPKLIQHLRDRYGEEFVLFGPAAQRGTVRMEALASVYAADAIFVGDHCFADELRPNYWSDRLPETLGRGGFLIYPRTPGLEEQGYRSGEHLLTYEPGDLQDLDDWIDFARSCSPDERQGIADAGRELVRARHTYEIRAAQLLEALA